MSLNSSLDKSLHWGSSKVRRPFGCASALCILPSYCCILIRPLKISAILRVCGFGGVYTAVQNHFELKRAQEQVECCLSESGYALYTRMQATVDVFTMLRH